MPQSATDTQGRRVATAVLVLLALAWFGLRIQYLEPFHFDWDSGQFTLGSIEFDVGNHYPHPPGYPLWILGIKLLKPLTGHPATAQVIMAIGFTVLGLVGFFRLAQRLCGSTAALWSTALMAFLPPVQLYASTQAVYAVDLCCSAWVGWFCAKVFDGDNRSLVWAASTAAVLMGFRQSGSVFLGLLLLVALIEVLTRTDWKNAALAGAAGAALTAAWYFPFLVAGGGFEKLRILGRDQYNTVTAQTSVFYGAPAQAHIEMLLKEGGFLLAFFLPVALALALVLALAWKRSDTGRAMDSPRWHRWWFYAVWIVPCVAFNVLIHCPKPGYYTLVLPPVMLIATRWIAVRAEGRGTSLWAASGAVAAVAIAVLTYYPLPEIDIQSRGVPVILRGAYFSSPQFAASVRDGKRELDRYIRHEAGLRPEQVILISCRAGNESPNQRSLSTDFPEYVQLTAVGSQPLQLVGHRRLTGTDLPPSATSILWVSFPGDALGGIHAVFPQTRVVLETGLYRLHRTDLDPGPLDTTIEYFGQTLRIKRAATAANVVQ